jgi:hypothetical protein
MFDEEIHSMGLDIWFAEDIRNALLAANEASAATVAVIAEVGGGPSKSPSTVSRQDSGQGASASSRQGPSTLRRAQGSGQAVTDSTELLAVSLRAYREGYRAALTTVALAFGIAPQAITLQPLERLGTIQGQDNALPHAQDEAFRPLDELGTIQAQDKALRQVHPERTGRAQDKALRQAQDKAFGAGPRDLTPQRDGEPEITYLPPEVGAV